MAKEKRKVTPEEKKAFQSYLLDMDLTIGEFAEKVGVPRQYISSILNGKNYLTDHAKALFKKGGFDFDKANPDQWLIEDCYLFMAVITAYKEFCKEKGLEKESNKYVSDFLESVSRPKKEKK